MSPTPLSGVMIRSSTAFFTPSVSGPNTIVYGHYRIAFLYDLMRTKDAPPDTSHAPYYDALEQLTVEKWRNGEVR